MLDPLQVTDEIYVMNPDGTNETLLLVGPAWDYPGDWRAVAPSSGCTIAGTAGDDELFGTRNADVICGLGGNDLLQGYGGNDVLRGGPGDDKLFGMGGKDRLEGGPGNDYAHGGAAKDVCLAETRRYC